MMEAATDFDEEITALEAGFPKPIDLGWMPMIMISHFNE